MSATKILPVDSSILVLARNHVGNHKEYHDHHKWQPMPLLFHCSVPCHLLRLKLVFLGENSRIVSYYDNKLNIICTNVTKGPKRSTQNHKESSQLKITGLISSFTLYICRVISATKALFQAKICGCWFWKILLLRCFQMFQAAMMKISMKKGPLKTCLACIIISRILSFVATESQEFASKMR